METRDEITNKIALYKALLIEMKQESLNFGTVKTDVVQEVLASLTNLYSDLDELNKKDVA